MIVKAFSDGCEGIRLDVVGHTEAHFSHPSHGDCQTTKWKEEAYVITVAN
jgi:hypothetical protein